MLKPKNDPFRYRRGLSQPMSELLADPLSELTRKRQPALLVAATIALLLSVKFITIAEVSVSDVKFRLELPQLGMWLAFAVTGYLLVTYVLGVWADWTIAKAKRWSALASISDAEASMVIDSNERLNSGEERGRKMNRLKTECDQIVQEMNMQLDAISVREREIESAISSMPEINSASYEENARRDSLLRESVQLVRSKSDILQERNKRQAPVVDALMELAGCSSAAPAVSAWNERLDLSRIRRIFATLTQLRLLLEVIFPAAYGLFALFWVVRQRMPGS